MHTTVISSTISHAAVLPTQVLTRSAACSSRCVSMARAYVLTNAQQPCGTNRRAVVARSRSGFLRLRLSEVAVPRGLEVDHVVALPAAGLLGEAFLRIEDL